MSAPPEPIAPGTRRIVQICGIETAFRWCPPGSFTRDDGQVVTLTRGFWMAETTVTQMLYQAVTGNNPSYFKGDDQRPVETVSWHDAGAFCAKAAQSVMQAGKLIAVRLRLPTEAEWEHAARAGTTGEPTPITDYAWTHPESDGSTQPVGTKKPNVWGLHDMLGNVWQWCLDVWHPRAAGVASEPMVDPIGTEAGVQQGFDPEKL